MSFDAGHRIDDEFCAMRVILIQTASLPVIQATAGQQSLRT